MPPRRKHLYLSEPKTSSEQQVSLLVHPDATGNPFSKTEPIPPYTSKSLTKFELFSYWSYIFSFIVLFAAGAASLGLVLSPVNNDKLHTFDVAITFLETNYTQYLLPATNQAIITLQACTTLNNVVFDSPIVVFFA